jgi:hypothetical protein
MNEIVVEETHSYWHHKDFISEFSINENGQFDGNHFRDICEIIGRDH